MDDQGSAWFAPILKKIIRVQSWPSGALSLPRYQAHRGYWKSGLQENTMDAFRAARERGAEMIEFDVRLSKDRIPVVFHDDNLARFSNLSTLVCDLTADELFEAVKAPRLETVLTSADVPQKFNIELKTEVLLDDPLERKVFEVISRAGVLDRSLISSFNPFSILRMSLHTDQLPLALLVANNLKQKSLRELWFAPLLKMHLIHFQDVMLTDSELEFWRAQGVPFAVWTVNDQRRAEQLLDRGALSVISDELIELHHRQ